MRWLLLLLVLAGGAAACGPGRGNGRRRGPRKLTPLVFKQHVPNVPENTLPASGLSEGRIGRNDTRFGKELVPNYNQDIIFKDEEGTGADRLMTQRCKEKLNTLAISVMNQWPGVRLVVTEGWDEEGYHSPESLHYEGRAVDVTTSDRDRSKYGMLARLAVESGFDWVYYESRAHIHCSVKSESSQAARYGGCFTSNDTIITSKGRTLPLSNLTVGDSILSGFDLDTASPIYSEVLLFLHRDPSQRRQFLLVHMQSERQLQVTPQHLVHTSKGMIYAELLRPGDHLLVTDSGTTWREEKIVRVELVLREGVYAPLTAAGTVVVDGVLVSCYAVVDSQKLAHWAFAPLRVVYGLRHWIWGGGKVGGVEDRGVHWYARMLYSVAEYVIPGRLHR